MQIEATVATATSDNNAALVMSLVILLMAQPPPMIQIFLLCISPYKSGDKEKLSP
jgi:hypothetical protein